MGYRNDRSPNVIRARHSPFVRYLGCFNTYQHHVSTIEASVHRKQMNPGHFEHKNKFGKLKAGRSTSTFPEVPEDDTHGPRKPGTYAHVFLSLLLRSPSSIPKIIARQRRARAEEGQGRSNDCQKDGPLNRMNLRSNSIIHRPIVWLNYFILICTSAWGRTRHQARNVEAVRSAGKVNGWSIPIWVRMKFPIRINRVERRSEGGSPRPFLWLFDGVLKVYFHFKSPCQR